MDLLLGLMASCSLALWLFSRFCIRMRHFSFLFCQLQDGSSHQGTVTSMDPNEGTFVLHSETTKVLQWIVFNILPRMQFCGVVSCCYVISLFGQIFSHPKFYCLHLNSKFLGNGFQKHLKEGNGKENRTVLINGLSTSIGFNPYCFAFSFTCINGAFSWVYSSIIWCEGKGSVLLDIITCLQCLSRFLPHERVFVSVFRPRIPCCLRVM